MRSTPCLPADHGCESPAAVRPLAFGPVGFFLPGLAGLERELRIQAEGLLMQAEMLDWERTGYLGARAGADYHRMRMERLIAERSPETVAAMERERGLS